MKAFKLSLRKTVSILIAALMLMTSGLALANKSTAEADGAVLQQYDPAWGSYPYGDGNLGNSGCGALAIVNAVRYLTGNTMDIYAVADWGSANEYIWGVGSSFNIAPNAAAKFGSTYGFQLDTHYGFSSYVGDCYPGSEEAYQAAWNTLVTKLSAGEVAVGLVHNHFISIVDYDSATGKVLVYDPGAGSNRQTTTAGDWKSYDELNYWSNAGTSLLKLRGYLTFYFATGVTAAPEESTTTIPTFNGTEDAAGTYTVNTDGSALNMRNAASTSGSVIAQIPSGAAVQVLESDGTWASVTWNGISGYCSIQYLTRAEETTTETAVTTTTAATTTTAVTTEMLSEEEAGTYIVSASGSYLNMREEPNMSADVVTLIPDNTAVTVTAANSSWAAVTWNGNTGYCSMDYLRKAAETTAAATTETTAETTAAVTTETSAETTAEETTSAAEETTTTEATTTSEETTTTTTTTTTTAATETPAETTTETVTSVSDPVTSFEAGAYLVDTDGAHLNMRASGSMNASILTQIPNESEVFVISCDGDWANVAWNGVVGYCKSEYLSRVVIDAEESVSSTLTADSAFAVLYGDVNLDCEIDMTDVVLLHKALTGAITLNQTSAANADCYQDSKLNTVDTTVIIQCIVNNCIVPVQPVI